MNPSTIGTEKERSSSDLALGTDNRSQAHIMESVPGQDKESVVSIIPIDTDNAPRFLHGFKLFIVMLALLLSMFLVWLLPKIHRRPGNLS